jgi:lysozyme
MQRVIESYEGCKLTAYRDPVGIWTIGFGHTGKDVTQGLTITLEQAQQILADDIAEFERAVEELAPITTQQQFDALVSFAFNVGAGALRQSTLRRLHNEGKYAEAKLQFARWNKAGGKVLTGLTRRRKTESLVYGEGDYRIA